jgi:hypothetical protein
MKKATVILLAILVVSLFAFQPVLMGGHSLIVSPMFAHALTDNETAINQTIPTYEREFSVDRQFYKPVKIMVTYPYTHNTNVTDITTIGPSRYIYDVTPSSLTFIAEDIDIYTFTVQISYDNATTRNVLITIWQGDLPAEGYTWTETANTFVVHVKINMTEQPHYPTESAVAKEVVNQLQQTFIQQLEEQRRILAEVQSTNSMNSMIGMVNSVVCVIALLLAGFGYRRKRLIPAEGS